MLVEVNFDALVGPTHHFGGLGVGNVASQAHAHRVSSPRQAALEGLKKELYDTYLEQLNKLQKPAV